MATDRAARGRGTMTRRRATVGVLAAAVLLAVTVVYLRTREEGGQALGAGRHLVHVVELNVDEMRLTVDVAAWLTGDAADVAWNDQHPDDPTGAPNGFFILDEDDSTAELDIADDVEVSVVDLARDDDVDLDTIELTDLSAYLAQVSDPAGRGASPLPFWLAVRDDGRVALIEEQYVP